MKKRNWKLGGLLVLLIALTFSVCIGALAEDEEQPASFDVNVPWRVPQGDDLELSISTFKGATQYEIAIFDPVTWKRTYSEIVTSAEADAKAEDGWFAATIPAENLQETGMYNLRIYAQEVTESFVNYLSGCGRYPVVYAAGDLPENEEPALSVQSGEHPLYSSLYAVMTAPGAEAVMVGIDGDAWTMDGDWGMYPGYVDHAGIYTITGTAVYPDGTQVTKTETIEVKGEAKSLGKMNITLPEIDAGEEATISFSKVSNADVKDVNYYVEVLDQSDLQRYIFAKQFQSELDAKDPAVIAGIPDVELMGDSQTLTVNGENFQAGHGYLVRVVAASAGYEDLVYQNWYYIPPTEGSYKIWPSFYFPGEEGVYSKAVEASQEFPVCLQLQEKEEGALDTVRVVRICNGWNEYEDFANWGDAVEQMKRGEEFGFTRSFDSGEYAMYIQVGYGGPKEDWTEEDLTWVTSNLLYVTVEADGRVSVPSFDVSATTVTRGDMLVISNVQMDDRATNVDVWMETVDGYNHYDDYRMNSEGEIRIPTLTMVPGTYHLTLNTYGPGLNSSAAHAMITIQENEKLTGDAVYISASQTEVLTHQQVRVSALAPGANRLKLIAYDEYGNEVGQWENWWETIDEWVGGWDAEGIIRIEAVPSYYDAENDEWNWDADGSQLKITVTADGTLEDPAVTLDGSPANGTITEGEELSGTITVSEDTDWAYVELVAMWDGGEDTWASFDLDFSEEGKTSDEIFFSADCFGDNLGITFEIRVHANAVGKNSGHVTSNRFVFVGKQDEEKEVVLTVNGKVSQNVGLLSSQSVTVHVDAPDATVVRVLNDRGWEFWWGEDDYTRDWGYGDGEYQLIAMASYDPVDIDAFTDEDWQNFDWDRDLSWTGISNVTYLHVSSPYGELREPNYHFAYIEQDEDGSFVLIQGDYLYISMDDEAPVPVDENAKAPTDYWYYVELEILREGEDGNTWWDWVDLNSIGLQNNSWHGETGFLQIPSFKLEAGTYRVCIGVDAIGWVGNSAVGTFSVSEMGELPPASFMVSPTSALTQEQIRVYLYVDGAVRTQVRITREDDFGWNDELNADGDMLGDTRSFGTSGTYILTPVAWFEGNDAPEVFEPATEVTITANGDLADFVLHDFPGVVTLGEGIEASFDALEGAGWYDLSLQYAPDQGDWEDLMNDNQRDPEAEDATKISIPADLLTREGRYRFSLYAGAKGLNDSYLEKYFLVTGAVSEEIELSINGETSDIKSYPAGTYYEIEVYAPGATAVRVMSQDGGYDLSDSRGMNEKGYFFFGHYENSGTYTYTAQASYDRNEDGSEIDWDHFDWSDFDFNRDLNWTETSNSVSITIVAEGQLERPTFEQNKEELIQGEDLIITITNAQEDCGYNVFIEKIERDDQGNQWTNGRGSYDWNSDTGAVLVTTYDLEPGDYQFYVNVGRTGYDGNNAMGRVTIQENENPKPAFRMTKNRIVTKEDMEIIAYYPGADWIDIEITRDGDEEWHDNRNEGGESLRQYWSVNLDGIYTLTAIANQRILDDDGNIQFDEDGNELVSRTEFGDMAVTVTAQGDLESADLSSVPDVLIINEGIETSFPAIAHAEEYEVMLRYCPDDGEWEDLYDERRYDPSETALVFDGSYFIREGQYRLSVYAEAPNWNARYYEKVILVVSSKDDQVTLTVNGSTEPQTIQSQEPFFIRVSAEGANAIRYFNGNQWEYEFPNAEGAYTWRNTYDSGVYSFTAEATYGDPYNEEEIDWDSWNWESLDWGGISNTVKLTVTSLGQVEPGEFTMEPNEVKRGEPLAVSVSGSKHAAEFNFNVMIEEENGGGHNADISTLTIYQEGTVQIPTASLTPGEYHLRVWIPGEIGYDSVDIEVGVFTVTEEAEDGEMIFTVSKTEGIPHDMVNVMAYYPGAAHYELFVEDGEGEWEDPFDQRGTGAYEAAEFVFDMWSGLKTVWAVAYDDHHEELAASEKVAMAVKNTGKLSLKINLKAILDPMVENTFTVSGLDKATGSWGVELFRQDEGEWTRIMEWESWNGDSAKIFSIPAGTLEDGQIYHVTVGGFAYGLDDGHDQADAVCISATSVFRLKLPADIQQVDEDAFEGVPMEIVILVNDTECNLSFLENAGTKLLVVPDASYDRYHGNYGFAVVTESAYNASK